MPLAGWLHSCTYILFHFQVYCIEQSKGTCCLHSCGRERLLILFVQMLNEGQTQRSLHQVTHEICGRAMIQTQVYLFTELPWSSLYYSWFLISKFTDFCDINKASIIAESQTFGIKPDWNGEIYYFLSPFNHSCIQLCLFSIVCVTDLMQNTVLQDTWTCNLGSPSFSSRNIKFPTPSVS